MSRRLTWSGRDNVHLMARHLAKFLLREVINLTTINVTKAHPELYKLL